MQIKTEPGHILSFDSFSPPVSTWVKSIKKNYFSTWPGLTADLVLRYLPKSEFTSYGHLRQSYKGATNFVSVPQVEPDPDEVVSVFPESSNSEKQMKYT